MIKLAYWIIGLLLIGWGYYQYVVSPGVAADEYAARKWDSYLSENYPALEQLQGSNTFSKEQMMMIQSEMVRAQEEMTDKLRQYRAEYREGASSNGQVVYYLALVVAFFLLFPVISRMIKKKE